MKKPQKTVIIAALSLSSFLLPAQAGIIDSLPMDGYAAFVNERIITIGDIMLSTYEAQEQLRLRYSGETLKSRREELFYAGLERLIDEALILEEFKTQEGMIPERAIDERITDIVYENFDSDKPALLAALAADGVTLEEWRETIRERMIISAMRQSEIISRISISPKQIIDAYDDAKNRYEQPEQIKARLIFINSGSNPDEAFARIQEGRNKILSGSSFSEIAISISEDATAAAGGDWGWVSPGDLREELRSAIDGLPVQEITDVIYTPEGYYLIQIEERREAFTKSLADVQTEIENELREKESERLYRDWMARLRNKHSVLYFIPLPSDQS